MKVVEQMPFQAAIAADDLQRIAPSAGVTRMWLQFNDTADAADVMDSVQQAVGGVNGVTVDGAIQARDQFLKIMTVLVLCATGLLGVAVLIAVVGIANTLSLSVLERRREHGLLRALGLTRGQLRACLAFEALLLAGVAGILGLLLGAGYGWAGARALLGEYGSGGPVLPWSQLTAVLVTALVAGLLASVLPGSRASRVQPAAALAAE